MNVRIVLARIRWLGILLLVFGCDHREPDNRDNTPAELSTEENPESPRVSAAVASSGATPTDAPFHFEEMSPSLTGIDFRHVSGNSPEKPFPAANGSGAGTLDCDLDGLMDLCFATGTSFPIDVTTSGISAKFYRNLGAWNFEDVTERSGLEYHGYSVGVAVGDFDSDGFPDVYLTCIGENQLFLNDGDGTFRRVPIVSGGDFSTSAAALDFDGDGLLDLYVCNYGKWSWEQNPFCGDRIRNVRIFCSPKSLEPEPDRLLRNQGDGTFHDATAEAGLDGLCGRAQGVLATDVDLDGRTDLYIGNDIHPNFLFMNSGNGQFRNVTEQTGTAYDRQGQMQAGMGVAGADVNRDGKWDLFVTNFAEEYNTLYIQTSPDDFYDASMNVGLAAASRPWVGWGTAFIDFDLDGWMDLIVTNGHVDDNLKELGRDAPYDQPALVWKNAAGQFAFLGESAGNYFQRPHPGRGLVVADFDNDGDLDLAITHQDQEPALLKTDRSEESKIKNSSLTLRLIGTRSHRNAIGSRVRVVSDEMLHPQIAILQGGGSYLSAHDLRLVISVPTAGTADLEIVWPSGHQTLINGLRASQNYVIIEPNEGETATWLLDRPSHRSRKANHD